MNLFQIMEKMSCFENKNYSIFSLINYYSMKNLIPAYKGLSTLPKSLKFPIRLQIISLFIIPLVSMSCYDIFYGKGGIWSFIFGIVVVMHIGFVLNNLRVRENPIWSWWAVFGIPLQTFIFGWWLEWSSLEGFIHVYIFEIMGLCIGLLFGAVFRVATISIKHRLVSIVLALIFVVTVYFRFQNIFDGYLETLDYKNGMALFIPVLTASIPFMRLFVLGKEGEDLNMSSSPLIEKLSGPMGIGTILYIFLPSFLGWILH